MQTLTVCRFEADWGFRDVTGEAYGRSPDIQHTYEAAQQMARRIGAHIQFSPEAESHYRAMIEGAAVDVERGPVANNVASRARAFLKRFA